MRGLRDRRELLGISRADLAHEAGLSDETIRKAELGLSTVRPETMQRIEAALERLAAARQGVMPPDVARKLAQLEAELGELRDAVRRLTER